MRRPRFNYSRYRRPILPAFDYWIFDSFQNRNVATATTFTTDSDANAQIFASRSYDVQATGAIRLKSRVVPAWIDVAYDITAYTIMQIQVFQADSGDQVRMQMAYDNIRPGATGITNSTTTAVTTSVSSFAVGKSFIASLGVIPGGTLAVGDLVGPSIVFLTADANWVTHLGAFPPANTTLPAAVECIFMECKVTC